MAPPLLQKARQRKIIYFGAIAVLLTVSLIHREFILKPQAFALQLRETSRGEVELTSSAVRLMLTGSRGIAVTLLWYSAMDRQKRNEWHELELIVKSITKLQPYFITPWLYQSWNISFNVAVECDRPRDKYYYISRGLELLAEGERRNRGVIDERAGADQPKVIFPGNPDMRYYMGFTYQLKMGTSDERLTMRCLLEMSCIDPVERNPDRFWTTEERGQKKVDLRKFASFCQKYPRLVRRLKEQLGFGKPEDVVRFLQDNQDIPNRFKPIDKAVLINMKQSALKEPDEQFPILPPHEKKHWPNRNAYDLTNEAVDVYLVCRTWYDFAQDPLPPPNPLPGVREPDYDKMKHRVPRNMVTQLFRYYPARAQIYIAETLESEGFFDSEGWVVPEWFDILTEKQDSGIADEEGKFVVGADAKYHSQRAWDKGHQMYKLYGIENGIYLDPGVVKELTEQAQLAREALKLAPMQLPGTVDPIWRTGEGGKSLEAHLRLRYSDYYRRLSNFDAFYDQADGERDPLTVCMRKLLFQAERRRRGAPPDLLLLNWYDQAWALYLQTCMEHPKFAQVTSMQEELYEIHQRSLEAVQLFYKEKFKTLALWFAFRSPTPLPNLSFPEVFGRLCLVGKVASEEAELLKIVPIRRRRGPLDAYRYYAGPDAQPLREALFLWTHGASAAMSPPLASTTLVYPGRASLMLVRSTFKDEPLRTNWERLITIESHRIVDMRVGVNAPRGPAAP